MTAGIYQIKNVTNGKVYIGSAKDFKARRHAHFSKLNMGVHPNKHLQAAYLKYGKSNFVFEKLIYCSRNDLVFYEQRFIDGLNPEYNKRIIASSNVGMKLAPCSDEKKKRISDALKGVPRRKHSDETKRKMSLAHKGYIKTPEHRANLSEAAKRDWAKRKGA